MVHIPRSTSGLDEAFGEPVGKISVLIVIGECISLYMDDDCFLLNAPWGFEKDTITMYGRGKDSYLLVM